MVGFHHLNEALGGGTPQFAVAPTKASIASLLTYFDQL